MRCPQYNYIEDSEELKPDLQYDLEIELQFKTELVEYMKMFSNRLFIRTMPSIKNVPLYLQNLKNIELCRLYILRDWIEENVRDFIGLLITTYLLFAFSLNIENGENQNNFNKNK
jgi:hypothetical protein